MGSEYGSCQFGPFPFIPFLGWPSPILYRSWVKMSQNHKYAKKRVITQILIFYKNIFFEILIFYFHVIRRIYNTLFNYFYIYIILFLIIFLISIILSKQLFEITKRTILFL